MFMFFEEFFIENFLRDLNWECMGKVYDVIRFFFLKDFCDCIVEKSEGIDYYGSSSENCVILK